MKAADVMMPIGTYLRPEHGIREFVLALEANRRDPRLCWTRTLLVLNAKGDLVGMVSITDILRAVYPLYLAEVDLSAFTWDGMLESMALHAAGKKVSDLMSTPVITVLNDHPLMECVDHMLKHGISTLPVLDHAGKLVGILHKSSIFSVIAAAMLGEADSSS